MHGRELWKLTPSALNATLNNGTLTITDDSGKNNDLNVGRIANNLVITDSNVPFEVVPTGGTLSNGNKTLTIPFSFVTKGVNINTGAGEDKVTIDDRCLIPTRFSEGINIDSGEGVSDSLRIFNHQTSNVWDITGAYAGQVNVANQGMIRFRNLERVLGGTGNDLFRIINLTEPFLRDRTMSLNYILAGTDTLEFESDARSISLGATGVTSSSAEGYQGFIFARGSIQSAIITGGRSANQINASTFTGPVRISGGDGNDMLFGGESNDIISGDSGDDFIEGNGGDDTLLGFSGRDVLVGGAGADILNSGGTGADWGDDLLIGGILNIPTIYGPADVGSSLLRSWATPATYLGHIEQLTSAPRNSRDYKLNATTVLDDNAIDTLFGGGGLDWFFADTSGTNKDTHDREGNEQVVSV